MENLKEYDITALVPGSMRACTMHGGGALWAFAEYDASMGLFFSNLNQCWLLDGSAHEQHTTLFLVPAMVVNRNEPEQYIVASEQVLRETLSLLQSGQSCIWERSKQIQKQKKIVGVRTRHIPEEGTVLAGELQSCLSGSVAPSAEDLRRAKTILEENPDLEDFLIGKWQAKRLFLYLCQRDSFGAE